MAAAHAQEKAALVAESEDQLARVSAEHAAALADAEAQWEAKLHAEAEMGREKLAAAVLAKPTLEVFSGIPLKELRADSLTSLDLANKAHWDESRRGA